MKEIRSNAEQLLRENYRGIENKKVMPFRKWVENESKNDPGFFYWLFSCAGNLSGDFGGGMTEEQKEEFKEFLSKMV